MFEALHATCRAMQTRLVELIDQVLVLVIVMVMVALVLLRVLVVVMGADAAGHSDEAMHLLSPVAGAQVQDDSLTADLLEVNDDMNNLFLRCQHSTEGPLILCSSRYDRYEKNKSQSQARQGAIKKSPAAAQV